MGYIDSDSHVIESADTWAYCDPGEAGLMPMIDGDHWTVEDHFMQWPGPMARQWRDVVFPGCDLVDIDARLKHMDDFGVDAQMLFPTWWLLYQITSPAREAAMYRSYNRWVAERTADSGGRLRWSVLAPFRTPERAVEEMEFGKANGAASVYTLGQIHGMSLSDPAFFPIYEKAQELDLAISVHVGTDLRISRRQPGNFLHAGLMVVPGAFFAILKGGLTERFPGLRWSFIEAGSTWLPFVLQEAYRADATGAFRSFKDWRQQAIEAVENKQLYVAVQMDDDIPGVLDLMGPDRLVFGTDYGHLDVGADPGGMHVVATRSDLDPTIARKIVDDNGRRLLGIDPGFCPAPEPTVVDLPAERVAQGLPMAPIG